MSIERKSVEDEDSNLTYGSFILTNLSHKVENIKANKGKREYELIAFVIKKRLEDNDSHYLHLIAGILNCPGWDKAKARTGNQLLDGDESEKSDNEKEEEEDIGFADENLILLIERFRIPLENAGVNVTSHQMLDEWYDLLSLSHF